MNLANVSIFARRLYEILPRGKHNGIKRDYLLTLMRRTPASELEHAEAFQEFDERQLRLAKNELEQAGLLLGPGGYIITDYNEACDTLVYWEKHQESYDKKVRRIRAAVNAMKPALPQQPWNDTPLGKAMEETR